MVVKSAQNFVHTAKRFYWARRQDPFGFRSIAKWSRPLKRAAEVSRYALTGNTNIGFCPVCERNTVFVVKDSWLRDNYLCYRCRSIPRVRHMLHVLQTQFPRFRELTIFESSPSGASFGKFRAECKGYIPTYYWPDVAPGSYKNEFRCETLEALTFPDDSFDLVITQDVMEHVMNPDRAFLEIARVLKPGGAHVFTIPWYAPKTSFVRAAERDGNIEYFAKKDYHGNPVDGDGALVVTEWGVDLPEFIFKHSGLITTVFSTRDRHFGLAGEFIEVFVSRKPK